MKFRFTWKPHNLQSIWYSKKHDKDIGKLESSPEKISKPCTESRVTHSNICYSFSHGFSC